MRTARCVSFSILFILMGAICRADSGEDHRRALVQAATQDAMHALRHDVLAAPITASLTVGEFVDQYSGQDGLEGALRSAQQVGGTRWIGDDTCMVRVELNGDNLASTLSNVARARPKDAPLLPAGFETRLASFRGRTFSAEGTSTGAASTKDIRPAADNIPWRDVTADARRDAVASARAGAAERVLNSLGDVRVSGEKTVGDALDVESVRSALREWLANRPVTEVHFHPDLNVELTLAAPADDLWPVLRKALESQTQIPAPASEADWSRLHADTARHIAPAVGRALAARIASTAHSKAAVALPERPPKWVNDSIDASGSSKKGDGKLLTKKRAEDDALRDIRRQIEKLPIDDGHTLGDAARADVGSSRVDLQACKLEYSIVSPK